MDWKAELIKRLDALAEKLGTTGAYLWSMLVKQAYYTGIQDAIWAAAFLIVAILGYKGVRYSYTKSCADHYGAEGWVYGVVFGCIGVVACVGLFLGFSTEAIKEIANPGYYALKQILETVGK